MPNWAPEPPVALPAGCIVHVPGRGEMFLRDSGGDGPPVLLLHGWMFSADLNWYTTYGALEEAGYRVLAVDHRGHGRGIRTRRAVHAQGLRRRRRRAARAAQGPAGAGGRLQHGRPDRLDPRPRPPEARRRPRPRRHGARLEHPAHEGVLAHDGGAAARARPRTREGLAARAQSRRLPRLADHHVGRRGAQPRQLGRPRRGRPRARPLRRDHLDRRPRRPARGPPHHQGHRRPAVQAARARRRALARPIFEVHGDHGAVIVRADEFNAQLLAALDSVRDPRAAATR